MVKGQSKKNETESLNKGGSRPNSNSHTDREVERKEEDDNFVPVIVKRTDEALRHPDDILEKAIKEGVEQQNRAFFSLFLSAMAAGLILGFTAMSVAIVESQMLLLKGLYFARLATAIVYPLGFVLCIMSGAQLFTEHTATAVYPVLDGQGNIKKLLRLWVIVIIGNLVGALFSSVFFIAAEDVINAQTGLHRDRQTSGQLPNQSIVFQRATRGVAHGAWAWLILSTSSTISQIASIYIVTFVIGIGGLHHSITGSVEMFTAYLISDIFSIGQVFRFVVLAIAGNLVGGSIFVALLNYGHIRKTQTTQEAE